jgi:hypothetical protein
VNAKILSSRARRARIISRMLGVGFVAIGLVEIYNWTVSAADRIGWAFLGIRILFLFGPLLLTIGAFLIFYRRPIARVRGSNILVVKQHDSGLEGNENCPPQIGKTISLEEICAPIIRRILGVGFVAIGLVETYNFQVPPGDRIGWALRGIGDMLPFFPLLLIIGASLIFYRHSVALVRGSNIYLWIGCGLLALPVYLVNLTMASLRLSGQSEIVGFFSVLSMIFFGLPGLVFVAIGLRQRYAQPSVQSEAQESKTRSPNL